MQGEMLIREGTIIDPECGGELADGFGNGKVTRNGNGTGYGDGGGFGNGVGLDNDNGYGNGYGDGYGGRYGYGEGYGDGFGDWRRIRIRKRQRLKLTKHYLDFNTHAKGKNIMKALDCGGRQWKAKC